jgi:16S rRNA (cytosine1402-N4)-methyltransferase
VRGPEPSFELPFKGHIAASDAEAARNPRARSAKLRAGIRTAAPPMPAIADEIGLAVPLGTRH